MWGLDFLVLYRVCWLHIHNKLFTPQYFLLKSSSISLLLYWSNLHLTNELDLTLYTSMAQTSISIDSCLSSVCLPVSLACLYLACLSDVCPSVLVNHLFVYPPSVCCLSSLFSVCRQPTLFSVCRQPSFLSLSGVCHLSFLSAVCNFMSAISFFCLPSAIVLSLPYSKCSSSGRQPLYL
jgi:hypothetical protein